MDRMRSEQSARDRIRQACELLFPSDQQALAFLQQPDFPSLLKAYEVTIGIQGLGGTIPNIVKSFSLLRAYAQQKTSPRPTGVRIIAVGGAKGGIGKSLFAANLSIILANRGYKVVVADLDLGGANMGIYLGEGYLASRTLNQFLAGVYRTLDEIMVPTRYGPVLISGDSSQLGSPNISHAQKLKLLKALRGVEADFLILDLGGDTSFNVLDFYLAADLGIVLTTPESTACIGAYQFIKTALHRRLSRLLKPKSKQEHLENEAILNFFKVPMYFVGEDSQSANLLIQRAKDRERNGEPVLLRDFFHFQPFLLVNKVARRDQAERILHTIQDLARERLAVAVEYAGYISSHHDIEIGPTCKPIQVQKAPSNFVKEMNLVVDRTLTAGSLFLTDFRALN